MATTDLSSYDKTTIPNAENMRFGIVVSAWNTDITENLYNGAYETLIENNVLSNNIIRINVPGSFELIYGCKLLLKVSDKFDALIAIGSVIEGETKHFDFVCQGVSQGIKDLNILFETPIIFCVLTDTIKQQSIDRSGGKHGNKGVESAISAIQMASLNQMMK